MRGTYILKDLLTLKSFLRNKEKPSRSDEKVPPQPIEESNTGMQPPNQSEEMEEESAYSDSNDSQATTEAATPSQRGKRKNDQNSPRSKVGKKYKKKK